MNKQAIELLKELQRKMIMTPAAMSDFLGYDVIAGIKARGEYGIIHPFIEELEKSGYIGRSMKVGEVQHLPVMTYMLTEKGVEVLKGIE